MNDQQVLLRPEPQFGNQGNFMSFISIPFYGFSIAIIEGVYINWLS